MGGLVVGTNEAGRDELPGISGDGGPPETLLKECQGSVEAWVTVNLGGMPPEEYRRTGG